MMAQIMDRLMKRLGYQRSTTSNPGQWLIDWALGGSESSTGVKVTAAKALEYTPFWAAVRVISGTLAALPFKTYRYLDGGGKELAPKHRVYQLLHNAPNEYMSAVKFLESRQAHVLCYGNGYAEIQRDGSGRPIALWPLLPDKTERKLDAEGTPYYEVRIGESNTTVKLLDENVLHIMGLGFDGYTGYDVVSYHKEAIGYGIGVKEYGARFFGNGANPGGVLEHPGQLSKDAQKRIGESWEKNHQGLSQAHRLQILEEGMKWRETGVDPQKAQALEVQKWTVDDCARIFQVPPHKIGSMEYSKYNNVEQLNLDFYCTTMLYWFRTWEQEVNRKLFMPSEQGRFFCEILADAMLRGNVESRAQFYAAGRQWGFLSINDIRGKENMNPIGPDGDIYLDPLNMVPAGSPNPKAQQDSAIRAAHRDLLASQFHRIIKIQTGALQKEVTADWWDGHRTRAQNILNESARAYASLVGVPPERVNEILARTFQRWIQPTLPLSHEDAQYMADDLMNSLGGSYADSKTEGQGVP